MKGTKMAILIISGVLCMVVLLSVAFSQNRKLIINEFASIFNPTIFLNYQINIDAVEKMEIMGIRIPPDTGNHRYVYDKQNILKIISYLNSIPLVEAKRGELPNMSPDVTIQYSDENDKMIGAIWVYGQVFIEDRLDGKLYRSKKGRIIDGIEQIVFD